MTKKKPQVWIFDDKFDGLPKKDEFGRFHSETGITTRLIPEDWDGKRPLRNFDTGHEDYLNSLNPDGTSDGVVTYHWHGLLIDPPIAKILIKNPDQITAKWIDSLDNIEIRRVAMERMGYDKYLQESKFTVLAEDYVMRLQKPGSTKKVKMKEILVQKKLKGDKPLTGVFVINASPNGHYERIEINWKPVSEFPDFERIKILKKYENTGSLKDVNGVLCLKQELESGEFIPDLDADGNYQYKTYFLPVHEALRPFWFRRTEDGLIALDADKDPIQEFGEPQEYTVHNAKASTFGLYGDEYVLDVES